MADAGIVYKREGPVGVIRLARPEKLNAVNAGMIKALASVFDETDADDAVRAIIVTGEGKAFCAGADISEGASGFTGGDVATKTPRDGGGLVTLRIFNSLKPVIAAINGAAVGFGATMQLPMDFRLCTDTAKFAFPFTRRGIVPDGASSYFLPRLVGVSRAMDWCMTGRTFLADEAFEAGLVNKIVAIDELMPAALEIAEDIAAHAAPVSVALTRQMLWRGLGMSHPMEAHVIESKGVYDRARSGDAMEGVGAFLQKRPPAFPERVSADMPDFYPWQPEPEFR